MSKHNELIRYFPPNMLWHNIGHCWWKWSLIALIMKRKTWTLSSFFMYKSCWGLLPYYPCFCLSTISWSSTNWGMSSCMILWQWLRCVNGSPPLPPLVHRLEHQVQVWCIWRKSLEGAMNKPIIMCLVTNLNTNVGH